jgi:YqaJ-like viral recombinase domain
MRKRGVGASEMPAIAGLSEFATIRDVYRKKVGLVLFEGNQATRIGTHFEPCFFSYLKEYHLQKYQCQRNTGIYVQNNQPYYCTPDGFAINDEIEKPMLLELKISGYFSRKKLACAEAQVQYTMHILNLDEAMICVLQGTKVDLVRIPRDHSGGEKLYKLARTFWDDFVVKGVEPPHDDEPPQKGGRKKKV